MRKVHVFLALLIAALAALAVLVVAGFYMFAAPAGSSLGQNWMSSMGSMMGNGNTGTQASAQNSAWPYLAVGFIVLIGVAIAGVGGAAYYVAFPEIRIRTAVAASSAMAETVETVSAVTTRQATAGAYDSVVKTLTSDERKVIEVLTAHEGRYLQKYIRSETGLSRLQTHRIVARLAERGIVTLEKTGNTNRVQLADWLSNKPAS
jgi:uncharacterized membrane protein